MATITISGRVVDRGNRRDIAGLRVEAWIKSDQSDSLVARSGRGVDGSFTLSFDAALFPEPRPETRPYVYFKVFRDDRLLTSTEDSVRWTPAEPTRPVLIELDLSDADAGQLRPNIVRGRVVQPDGSPLVGVTVEAFDKDLRRETRLGETRTDEDGRYLIRYASHELSHSGKLHADLIVRASRDGIEVATSALICQAAADQEVVLVVGNQPLRGPSEYDTLVAKVGPYLGETALADLKREDVQFLVCSAEVDRHQVATLIVANRLARETSLPDWLFYALGRQGLRLQLAALVLLSRQTLSDALSAAVNANIVSTPSAEDVLRSLVERLQAVLIRAAFEEPREGERFSMGALLGTSLVGRDLQEAFLAKYLARPESPGEPWKTLEEDARFSSEAINDLRLTLLLGRLTRYRLPLLAQLKRLRQNGEVRSLRDLVRIDRARWREILRAATADGGLDLPADIPGETAEDRLEHYITSLRAPIESLFPSDSLRRALTTAAGTETNLRRLLANAEDFDLYWTNVDAYVREHREAALSGIAASDHETVVTRVKGIQRLLRVSPRADHVRVLDAAGYDSALAIARTSKRDFKKRFVEMAEELKDTLDDAYTVTIRSTNEEGRETQTATLMMVNSAATPDVVADAIHGAAVSLAGAHLQQLANLRAGFELSPAAIGGPGDLQKKAKEVAFKAIPDLETLFGSQSFCECEHCGSVYSPAAYLVDLLHSLDDLTKQNGKLKYARPIDAPTPIGELVRRRPDIQHIALTCENTNTPLPYIDLVNEALESFIESHLDAAGEWMAIIPSGTPTIKQHDTGKVKADELRAVPQYVVPKVYAHLARKAVYPMTLPFHRPLEVARAYLGHLGTSRAEIMEVFRTASAPSELALAVERLGMCPSQYQIIAAAKSDDANFPFDPAEVDGLKDVWTYYGYDSATALSGLMAVPELLLRTGVTLEDLVAVLKTRFLNPYLDPNFLVEAKPIEIAFPAQPGDDACDVSRMTLANVPAGLAAQPWFDRLHRFIRLWRAVGWTAIDVDRALASLGGALGDTTLQKLAALKELATTLERPVASLLVLWGDLDTWGVEIATAPVTAMKHREESLYAEVFLNRAVAQDEKTREVFESVLLPGPGQRLHEHVPKIAAALAITGSDIERIRDHAGLTGSAVPLDLAALSTLCRYATLAKALGIRVRDLITLLRLVPGSMNPFTPTDPRPALEFVRTARSVEASGFPIPLLNYLFRDESEPTHHPAPTRALIETTVSAMASGLSQIHQETQPGENPQGETLREQLDSLRTVLPELQPGEEKDYLRPEQVQQVVDVIDFAKDEPELPADTPPDPAPPHWHRKRFLEKLHATLVKFLASSFLDTDDDGQVDAAVLAWVEPLVTSETVAERFEKNLEKLRVRFLPWLRRRLQRGLVIQTLANALKVDPLMMRLLLVDTAVFAPDPTKTFPAIQDFLNLVGDDGATAAVDLNDLQKPPVKTLVRLFKAGAYINGFGTTEEELTLFAGSLSPLRKLDPNDANAVVVHLDELPIIGVLSAADPLPGKLFEVWRALRAFYELRQALPRSEKTLVDYCRAKTSDKAATLEEASGWDPNQTSKVFEGFGEPGAAGGPTPPTPPTLPAPVPGPATVRQLVRLQRAMALLNRVGATPERMFAWAGKVPDHAQADEIVQTVKARYEQARWLEVARALNDPLREKQRDALVALLLVRLTPVIPVAEWPHPVLKESATGAAVKELQKKLNATHTSAALLVDGKFGPKTGAAVIAFQKAYGLVPDGTVGPLTWSALDRLVSGPRSANDLLEHLLLDVEISSCMLTSRIKQAISSVQLFVQRCLLNLEPAVSPEEIDPDRWEWMKHYRIWEANRKVFLYPETYILPELRDDKTPFFKELETELLQNELTDETIERAFGNYLYKLDEVARLDIRAFCNEEDDDREIFHVFGRTWNSPHVYYYRRGEFKKSAGTGEWTPWERVDLDVQGDHLIPVVWNRRLYLFWAIFKEVPRNKAEERGEAGERLPLDDDSGPFNDREIRLAWSERRQTGWSAKRTAKKPLLSRHFWLTIWLSTQNGLTFHHYTLFSPGESTHYFKAITEGDRLTISVYRRGQDSSHNDLYQNLSTNTWYYLEGDTDFSASFHGLVGTFRVLVCHVEMTVEAETVDLGYGSWKGPQSTINEFMDFRSQQASGLIFQDQAKTTVLNKGVNYTLLGDPRLLDPSKLYYPFIFEDAERTYFARPVVEPTGPLPVEAKQAGGLDASMNEQTMPADLKELLGPSPKEELELFILDTNA